MAKNSRVCFPHMNVLLVSAGPAPLIRFESSGSELCCLGTEPRSRKSDSPSCFKPQRIPDTDLVTVSELPLCHVFSRWPTHRALELTLSACWFTASTGHTEGPSGSLEFPLDKSSSHTCFLLYIMLGTGNTMEAQMSLFPVLYGSVYRG